MSKNNYLKQTDDARMIETQTAKFMSKLQKQQGITGLKCAVKVFPEAKFPFWATFIADLLCQNPDLAKLPNKELAAMVTNENDEHGFDASIMSKKLSEAQRKLVAAILCQHGYASDTLEKGTDIKRIVKDDLRSEAPEHNGIVFFADGVEIDGRKYLYRQRDAAPAGTPWSDFSIRVCGMDTRLLVILKLRGICVGEFQNLDAAAIKKATLEERERRADLDREGNTKKIEHLVKKMRSKAVKQPVTENEEELETA